MSIGQTSPARAPLGPLLKAATWCAILPALVWAPLLADAENPQAISTQSLDKHITLSVRGAPMPVFISALLANTGFDIEMVDDVDKTVSGDYTGTINNVLSSVSAAMSLNVEIDQSSVRISNQLIKPAPSISTTERIVVPEVVPAIALKPDADEIPVTPDERKFDDVPIVDLDPTETEKPIVATAPVEVEKPVVAAAPVETEKPVVATMLLETEKPAAVAEPVETKKFIVATAPSLTKKTIVTKPDISKSASVVLKPESDKSTVNVAQLRKKSDQFVEILFKLKNANVADVVLNDARQTVVPGAVTQLKNLMSSLGADDLHYQNSSRSAGSDEKATIVALPSLNAIKVNDRSSKMPLYRDLIESIDSANRTAGQSRATATEDSSQLDWGVVR